MLLALGEAHWPKALQKGYKYIVINRLIADDYHTIFCQESEDRARSLSARSFYVEVGDFASEW